jgi:hypothetical protein
MQRPDLRNPKRAATPSIRGYCFQFLCTLQRWLEIKDDELIWCEGSEDIDRMITDGSLVEEQVKHLAAKITDASSAITSTVLNFAQGFTYNHQWGYHSHHIFRTTAELGDIKDQDLKSWLSGEALTQSTINSLINFIQSLASKKDDESAKEALAYLSTNRLEQQFLESCSWVFSEISYDEMMQRFCGDIVRDDRCRDIDPELVAKVAISRISEVSSREELSSRCLSRYDFDCLVNDLQISKVATKYNQRGSLSERVVSVSSKAEITSAVVLRFHSINDIRSSIQEGVEYVRSHPRCPDDDNLNSILRSELFLDRLSRLDFDAYIAYGNVKTTRKQHVKERWLARRAITMSSFRDYSNSQVAMDDSLQRVLHTLLIPVRNETGDDCLLVLTHIIAEWILELVSEFSSSHRLLSISSKIRCICKWDIHQFTTQEDPVEEWFSSS